MNPLCKNVQNIERNKTRRFVDVRASEGENINRKPPDIMRQKQLNEVKMELVDITMNLPSWFPHQVSWFSDI